MIYYNILSFIIIYQDGRNQEEDGEAGERDERGRDEVLPPFLLFLVVLSHLF